MRMPSPATQPWACHWGYVNGPSNNGRRARTLVWICEYPYRTIRLSGPSNDCEGCRRALEASRQADAALEKIAV